MNSQKIILDLCGGTGEWSRWYALNGYDRRIITWPERDVRDYEIPQNVYGILAAPDCRDFAGSGAQYWAAKDADGRTQESLKVVVACIYIITYCKPVFWCMENPVGRLPSLLPELLGKPLMYYQPWEYGDPYTKRTCLWGRFNLPTKNPVEPIRSCSQGSWVQRLGGKGERTKLLRSITPAGFAKAFYEANK